MLDQEIASIIRFTHREAGSPSPYYEEIPEGFLLPAVYYPTPEARTRGDTLQTYAMEYTWFIKFFHLDMPRAYELAFTALTALQASRCLIPLITLDGAPTGRSLRIKDPALHAIGDRPGAAQLTLTWNSPRPYTADLTQKMMRYTASLGIRER